MEINSLSLKFTIEHENDSSISFLDMNIQRKNDNLCSKWYTKPTDTGLTMNYHALAPIKYKRSVVSGLMHRIYRSCSNWLNFHESLGRGKVILENNQFPKSFYEPIVAKTVNKIIEKSKNAEVSNDDEEEEEEKENKMIFVTYRDKVSEKFEKSLKIMQAPCKVLFSLLRN